jgi:hypothetical protein
MGMTMSRTDKRKADFVLKLGAVAPVTNPVEIGRLRTRHYSREQFITNVLGRRAAATDQPRRDVVEGKVKARRVAGVRKGR